MAKSVHPKKKRITHIANLSDSNLESDTGSVLLGCFDYVDIIMKEMDTTGMKSVDCNKFYRQDADAMNPKAQKNKNQNLNVPNSNDSSQKLKNADSRFKKLSAARKFPLMEKSQKVLKQLKHNRSIPKQRAHLASIPASPVRKIRHSSELFQRKGNRNAEQKKKAKQKELTKKITCSKKTVICPQNSKTFLKSGVSQYCSDIQNKIKGSTKKKSNVQHGGIKGRSKRSACNELHSIDKKIHANTYQKIDSEIQLNIVQESHDSHSIEKTSTKDDDTTDSEYERFVQNNKSESRKTIKKSKKKSVKKRKVLKKNPKRTKEAESVIYESEQSISSITKKRAMQTESIFQSEQCETNYTVDSSDSAENILSKLKNNYKSTNDESETNLSMPKRALETETFQFEQYDSNCMDSSSDSDYAENILEKKIYNPEITTKLINESEMNVSISKEKQTRIIETESIFPSDQYRSNCKNDFSDYAQNLLEKENELKTMKSFEFTNDQSGKNLSQNSRISASSQETVDVVAYQVGESTMQNDCSNLKKNDLNMPRASECRNLCLQKLENVPVKHEDIVKQNSITHITHSNDSKKDVVNMEVSMNESHLEKQNINSTSSDNLNQTVNLTNYNEYKSSENLILIDLSSSDTETENIGSFASSATPVVENSKIVDLQNTATNSEDSDLEVIEVISVPNINKKVYTCNTLVNAGDCLKHMDSNECPKLENTVKGSPEIKYSQFVNTSDKHIKKEKVQNHSAVFKTNICKDELSNSFPGYCKSETSFQRSNFVNSAVQCEDDIIIIDPEVQIKKETCDDDVIIDAVVYKCQNSNMKPIISVINSVSQNENSCATVKKELNPMTMLTSSLSHLENLQRNISQVNRSESTNAQNTNCFKQLESSIKNESSTICSKSDIQSNSSLVKKELQNSPTPTSSIEGFHNIAHDNSAVLQLLDIYKKEFNIYKEIVRTEENVEVGLKFIEAHQAEKLKSIRSLIQKIVKSDQSFNNIYSESLLCKEKKSHDTVQSSTQNKVQTPECRDLDSSKDSQLCIPQGSSTIVSSDVSSCIQDIPCVSSTAIKTEVADEKPDVSKLVNRQIQQTNRFKSEIGFMLNASSTTTYSDLQYEENQEMKLFGKKCDVCGKEAVAACQGCAKAFFCSHKCGKKYWSDGHENVCGK